MIYIINTNDINITSFCNISTGNHDTQRKSLDGTKIVFTVKDEHVKNDMLLDYNSLDIISAIDILNTSEWSSIDF